MTAPAHTPGPWQVDDDGSFTVRDSNFDFVADARSFAYTDAGEEELPTNEANARLIAAAPALLEALQGMIDAYWRGSEDSTDAKAPSMVKAALAAIKKATGQ